MTEQELKIFARHVSAIMLQEPGTPLVVGFRDTVTNFSITKNQFMAKDRIWDEVRIDGRHVGNRCGAVGAYAEIVAGIIAADAAIAAGIIAAEPVLV